MIRCEPCCDVFHGDAMYATHITGKRHLKRVQQQQYKEQQARDKELKGSVMTPFK